MHVCIDACVHNCLFTMVHAYTHIHIYVYVYMHICIYISAILGCSRRGAARLVPAVCHRHLSSSRRGLQGYRLKGLIRLMVEILHDPICVHIYTILQDFVGIFVHRVMQDVYHQQQGCFYELGGPLNRVYGSFKGVWG